MAEPTPARVLSSGLEEELKRRCNASVDEIQKLRQLPFGRLNINQFSRNALDRYARNKRNMFWLNTIRGIGVGDQRHVVFVFEAMGVEEGSGLAFPVRDDRRLSAGAGEKNRMPVLAPAVEQPEDLEGVPVRVLPVAVRLYEVEHLKDLLILDEGLPSLPAPAEDIHPSLGVPLVRRVMDDGEAALGVGLLPFAEDKLMGEVFENPMQVIEEIPDLMGEGKGWLVAELGEDSLALGFRIVFDFSHIWSRSR